MVKDILKRIRRTCKELQIEPQELTKAQFLSCNSDVTDWQLRKVGGIANLVAAYFPQKDKDLKALAEASEHKSYIKYLEKKLGEKQLFEEQLKAEIEKTFQPIQVKSFKPTNKNNKLDRELVVSLNDTHYGLLVDKEEVGGVNSYGWKEASRRTAMVVDEVCSYKLDKRDQVQRLHFVLNGDIIAGIIHNLTGNDIELLIKQFNGSVFILGNAIAKLAENFREVVVTGIGGNHGDAVHRREGGGRVVSQQYDNYENMIYYALSAMFKDVKNVSFNVPKTPYAFLDLPAGRAMIVHGHTIFGRSLGNPGSSLNIRGLSDAIHRFSLGEIGKGRAPIKLVLIGHTHCHVHFTTNDGVKVYNAPSMSGVDSYAHQLNINGNLIGQLVFESTPDYIMGDNRLIDVTKADNNANLENIIPTYDGSLKWKK